MVDGISSFSLVGSFFSIALFLIIPMIIIYFIIRLAVRHAIESSDVGQIIRKKYKEEKNYK